MSKGFRHRLLTSEPLIGTWLKTPSYIIAEVLGLTGLDCVTIDAEHAPFDRAAMDAAIAIMRASAMPSLVRVPKARADYVLNALDCGATGIVAPHITSVKQAEELVKMCRYGAGGRGYAGSSRAAGYTTHAMADNLKYGNEQTAIIAQIEDLEALENIDAIAAVEGVDCLFVGRIDLTVAFGVSSPADPIVVEAVEKICKAARDHDRAIGMFVSDMNEIPKWRAQGASFFLLKSEHAFILEGAKKLRQDFDELANSAS